MSKVKKVFTEPVVVDFSNHDSLFKVQRLTIEDHLSVSMGEYSFFLYVAEGSGSICINGSVSRLTPGTLCLLHAYHFFEISAEKNAPLSFCALSFDYLLWSYLFVHEYEPMYRNSSDVYCPVIHPSGREAQVIYSIFEDLEHEEALDDQLAVLVKTALIGQLVVLFRQCLIAEIQEGIAQSLSRAGRIIDYIYVFTTDISTSVSCAKHFSITTNEMNRELVSVSGHTFSWHVKKARVNKALQYIFYSDLSYRSIASMAGFSSESEFYKEFHELMDTTPKEYRDLLTYSPNGYKHLATVDALSVVTYILENYSDHISLHAVTEHFHTTPEKLNQVLKTTYGCTYRDLISQIQLTHARNLLGMSNFPLIDVAMYCGYNSASTFLRAFRKKYGIGPNEYRAHVKGAFSHGEE